MDGDFRDAMVSVPQPRNRLEDRRGKDDEISGGVWKIVEANSRKIRVAETERRRGKRRSGKEMRGARKKKKQKREKTVEVRRVAEEWEIWDKEKEAARSKEEAEKWVPEKFHQWIKVFGKKQLERMPTRKI